MSTEMNRLVEIMALLRDPEKGCPWDVEQNFQTIAPHTIEEAYEVADAIEKKDMEGLKDELGDLLLNVVFHARMAEEAGHFHIGDVAEAICDKLVRRHPHVFGDVVVDDSAGQTRLWEDQKADERNHKAETGALDGVVLSLPALLRAHKLQKRAARVGFDWPHVDGVVDKVREETDELAHEIDANAGHDRLEAELGDLLFTCVNVARKLKINPETALRRCNARFEHRFHAMERVLASDGKTPEDASLAEMDVLWNQAKRGE